MNIDNKHDADWWIGSALLYGLLSAAGMLILEVAIGGMLYYLKIVNIFSPHFQSDDILLTLTFGVPIIIMLYCLLRAILASKYKYDHYTFKFNKQNTRMDIQNFAIFPELGQSEFNFNAIVASNNYATISGLKVNIDKIYRDVTQTTVLAISGTMVINGVKVRGVWDPNGNIIEFKKMLQVFTPKAWLADLNQIFSNTTANIFRLVHVQNVLPSEL